MTEGPNLVDTLKKLRSNAPEWYDRYIALFEQDYKYQLAKLLNARAEEVCRQQGIVAALSSHLHILNLAK